MPEPISKLNFGAFVLAAFLTTPSAACCASVDLAPRISSQQKQAIASTRLPYTVGVAEHHHPAYSDGLLRALRQTHLFARVSHLKDLSTPPELVARVEDEIHGEPVIPFATGLSLGLIPTTVEEEWGVSFSLSTPTACAPPVKIVYCYKARTTLGLVSLVRAMSPEVTLGDAKADPRFREGVAATIADHADEISRMVRACSSPAGRDMPPHSRISPATAGLGGRPSG